MQPEAARRLLSFELEYPQGETTYVLVSKREKPSKVKHNGVTLDEVARADLQAADAGWTYLPEHRSLVIKVTHSDKDRVMIHY